MSIRTRMADWLLSSATRPTPGEMAGYGAESVMQFGDTKARLGRYDPSLITQRTYDAMEKDGQIGAGLDLVALTALSADVSVEGSDELAVAYVEATVLPLLHKVMHSCAWTGFGRGCAPHEVVWERRSVTCSLPATPERPEGGEQIVEGWVPAKVKDLDPASLQAILVDGLEQFAGYRVTIPAGVEVPEDKCLHYAHNMRFGNQWGQGALVRAYEAWYRFQVMWDQSVRYMERMATPPVLVRFVEGTTDGVKHSATAQAIGDALTDKGMMYAAVPASATGDASWDVEFKTDDKRSDMFIQMLNAHNVWKLRALLVPDAMFTQQAQTGSLALSETHFQVFQTMVEGLVDEVLDAVNAQLIPRIVRYTFGDVPAPRLTTQGLTDEKRAALYDVFKLGVQQAQASVDWTAVAGALDIPTTEAESAVSPDEIEQSEGRARKALLTLADEVQALRIARV